MSIIPSLPFDQVVRALQRDGWVVVRQKGKPHSASKAYPDRHSQTHRSRPPACQEVHTFSILKQARLTIEEFDRLL